MAIRRIRQIKAHRATTERLFQIAVLLDEIDIDEFQETSRMMLKTVSPMYHADLVLITEFAEALRAVAVVNDKIDRRCNELGRNVRQAPFN